MNEFLDTAVSHAIPTVLCPALLPSCRYVVTQKHVGDSIQLDVLRGGEEVSVEASLPCPAHCRKLAAGCCDRAGMARWLLVGLQRWQAPLICPTSRRSLATPLVADQPDSLPIPCGASPERAQARIPCVWRPRLHGLLRCGSAGVLWWACAVLCDAPSVGQRASTHLHITVRLLQTRT